MTVQHNITKRTTPSFQGLIYFNIHSFYLFLKHYALGQSIPVIYFRFRKQVRSQKSLLAGGMVKCGLAACKNIIFTRRMLLPVICVVTVSPSISSAVGSYKLGTAKASEVTLYLKYSAMMCQINPINQNEKAKRALAHHLVTTHKILSPACLD